GRASAPGTLRTPFADSGRATRRATIPPNTHSCQIADAKFAFQVGEADNMINQKSIAHSEWVFEELLPNGADVRANLPDPGFFLGKTVPSRPDLEMKELVDSGNDGHLFRAHSSLLRRDVACKIIPRSNLIHGPNGEETWQAEVHKADALRNPAVVK